MRTTITIDDELLAELMRVEPLASRSEAMRKAVEDYVTRRRREGFLALSGAGLIDLDWREAEKHELKKLRRDDRKR
jgi:Arc/MetJ family transcription regulator